MMNYTVKKIENGKKSLLHQFSKRDAAMEYAVNWSNENNISTVIYGANPNRAIYFTHRIAENQYQLFR